MKRDMDLIRKMILAVEAADDPRRADLNIEGYDERTQAYHRWLLVDDGRLVKGADLSTSDRDAAIIAMTMEGHAFADAIRDDTRWSRFWNAVKEKGGMVTIELIVAALKGQAAKVLPIG